MEKSNDNFNQLESNLRAASTAKKNDRLILRIVVRIILGVVFYWAYVLYSFIDRDIHAREYIGEVLFSANNFDLLVSTFFKMLLFIAFMSLGLGFIPYKTYKYQYRFLNMFSWLCLILLILHYSMVKSRIFYF